MRPPRVAYFPDSFHEVNGVAHTSRNFQAYAQRHSLPFLCVRAGDNPSEIKGSVQTLELPRSAAAVGVEKDLSFDPLFWRHEAAIADALHSFKPDLLHLTGPSELGIFAAYFAWKLQIPLAASWHTNVHEYAARRLPKLSRNAASAIENTTLAVTTRFYKQAQVLFAPNRDLCAMLEEATGNPCHLMQRGVDTTLFSPMHRTRPAEAKPFILGFVGRLSIEKNVALLSKIQQQLDAAGIPAKFLIIGQGDLEQTLRCDLPTADFAGVLRGQALSDAYANMDLFVFPSHTDTFGNVVLEALASGVPAIVTPNGGPKYIVAQGETGLIAEDKSFAPAILSLLKDPARLAAMRIAARAHALTCSWDAVFNRVYRAYESILPPR
jgi:phosphatidylinositol alpha 1,6-mannosyltransferase